MMRLPPNLASATDVLTGRVVGVSEGAVQAARTFELLPIAVFVRQDRTG